MSTAKGVFVGLVTLDVAHYADRLPAPDEKVTARAAELAAGGPAANAAVTFAALGGRATLVTVLGSGPGADVVRADLAGHGVRVLDLAAPGTPGPAAISSITVLGPEAGAARSVVGTDAVGDGGAGGAGEIESPAGLFAEVLDGAAVLLLDGHHPRLAMRALAAAREASCAVVIDVGRWKPVFDDLLRLGGAAHWVCSADARPPRVDTPDALAAYLLARGAEVVVATAGGGPVRVWTGGESVALDVPAVEAVDTLGAGDAFHGGYAHAIARGAEPVAAARAGIAVASTRVQHAGARRWLDAVGSLLVRRSGQPNLPVSATTEELIVRAARLAAGGRRRILAIAGAPGAGKSRLAAAIAAELGPERVAVVGMDGFHLANSVLESRGLRERKGAPETFDGEGYVALLRRLRGQGVGEVVVAPEYRREVEEAIAGAVVVRGEVPLVVTEGNYLLLADDPWRSVAALVDEVWGLDVAPEVRLPRLVARHVAHGKSPESAEAWAHGPDERNAALIEASLGRADRVWRLRD